MLSVMTPQWPAPANIRAYFTLRDGGVSGAVYRSLNLGDHVGDSPENVLENRRRLRTALNLPEEPRWLQQVHGVAVANLDVEAGAGTGSGAVGPGAGVAADASAAADAAVTRRSGVVCAILTADCLPVLLADIGGDAVAAAHAGWRGLASGVLEATVAALGQDPSRLLAWLGPAIGPRRFEVGAEVRDRFIDADPDAQSAFAPSPEGRHLGRYLADLGLLARQRLEALGVTRIFASRECTHSHPERFFSHRRDGQTGRHATLIWKS
jgi:YfiH family protein